MAACRTPIGFSALQRAENFSMNVFAVRFDEQRLFQCSSASRKFLNVDQDTDDDWVTRFQCSSASRKFLNLDAQPLSAFARIRFSALQRAENFSIALVHLSSDAPIERFSALQRAENFSIQSDVVRV